MRPAARTTIAILVIAITSTFALVGCTEEPGPTPLPTSSDETSGADTAQTDALEIPVISEPPRSEEEAIELGKLAIDAFFVVEAAVFNEHPEDTSDLATVASTDIVQVLTEVADQQVLDGDVRSGSNSFEVDDSRTVVGDEIEFTSTPLKWTYVEFLGCLIPEDLKYTRKDGSVVEIDVPTSYMYAVDYDPESSTWKVVGMVTNPENGVHC